MDKQPVAHPDYESLQSILNAIAQWMQRYRQARGTRQRFDELLGDGSGKYGPRAENHSG